MEHVFNSLGKPIYNFNGHKGFMIQWKLISPLCKKWSRNRDADMERVREMIEFHNKGGYIPRIIHLAELKEEGMVCFDGNHRKEVFNACEEDDVMCIVDVMFNATQSDVYKAFNNINKAIQLPAIYIEESNDDSVKQEIIQLVKEYETKYKQFVSTSDRCHAPHFNRDSLVDNIYQIYTSFNKLVSVKQIGKLLERLNAEYAKGSMCRPHTKYRPALIDKCKKYNLWLFMDKTIPFEPLEKLHSQTL